MIEKEKGEDHERVKEKDMGQLIVVKEGKGGKMHRARGDNKDML
jgi:hypothetical protein